jgi:hypothetical protein
VIKIPCGKKFRSEKQRKSYYGSGYKKAKK